VLEEDGREQGLLVREVDVDQVLVAGDFDSLL
jgi:hypothetical protein